MINVNMGSFRRQLVGMKHPATGCLDSIGSFSGLHSPLAGVAIMKGERLEKHLPYRAKTASGDVFDVSFPLHRFTESPVHVSNMVTAVLAALDCEVKLNPSTSNGDVLQALAMAISIRSAMIDADKETTDHLTADLVKTALAAMDDAEHHAVQAGHA
jgi:hypothetical protein